MTVHTCVLVNGQLTCLQHGEACIVTLIWRHNVRDRVSQRAWEEAEAWR